MTPIIYNKLSNDIKEMSNVDLFIQPNIIVTGVVNINTRLNDKERPYKYENRIYYLHILIQCDFRPDFTLSTRLSSCLGHFMLGYDKKMLTTTVTDHFTICWSLSKPKKKLAPR